MKSVKKLIIPAILILVLLQGCLRSHLPETEIITKVSTNHTETLISDHTTQAAENTVNVYDVSATAVKITDQYVETDIGKGSWILYKAEPEAELKMVFMSGEEKAICNDLPSPPSVSPDGKRIAFLSPYQWEVLSNVYIFDIDKNKSEAVLGTQELNENKNVREQCTPKKLAWLDDRYLLVIIQFAYGTETSGGDLYVYDTMEDSLRPLIKVFQKEQITDVKVDKDFVYLDLILPEDNSMNEPRKLKMLAKTRQLYEVMRLGNTNYNFDLNYASEMDEILNMERELYNYRFNEKEPYKELTIDLNGDGIIDEVQYQLICDNAYILKVNDVEISSYGDNLDKMPYLVDMDKNDSYKEIAIQEFGPSGDEKTYFYCYTGLELRFMGKVRDLCAENGHIRGDGRVISSMRPSMLQTWFVRKEYKLDENHLLEGVERELYPVVYEADALKLKTTLNLFDQQKSKNAVVELKAGDSLKLLGCDGIEWCFAETATGIKGWFAVDSFSVRENNLYVEEVFEGLSFAD